MTANLTKPRPDIVYIRRRLKKGETVPQQVFNSSTTSSLTLDNPYAEPKRELPRIPTATTNTVLTDTEPVVRLNRLQSAIGSLVIANASYVAWETTDGITGFNYLNSETELASGGFNFQTNEPRKPLPEVVAPQFRNRPFIQFHKEMLVVGLRNVKQLKRFIIVPQNGQNLQAGILTGVNIMLPYDSDVVMYGSMVDNCLEIRKEKYRGNLHETFNIGSYEVNQVINHTPVSTVQNFFSQAKG